MAKSRQRKDKIPVAQIRSLSRLQLTEDEAAAHFGVRPKVFREMLRVDVRAREAWEDGRALGKTSLRRKQLNLAETSAPMAIWLGRQWLGQTDIQVVEMSGRNGGPIRTLDLTKLDTAGRRQLRAVLEQARVKK